MLSDERLRAARAVQHGLVLWRAEFVAVQHQREGDLQSRSRCLDPWATVLASMNAKYDNLTQEGQDTVPRRLFDAGLEIGNNPQQTTIIVLRRTLQWLSLKVAHPTLSCANKETSCECQRQSKRVHCSRQGQGGRRRADLAQDLGLLLRGCFVEEAHHLDRQIWRQPATEGPPATLKTVMQMKYGPNTWQRTIKPLVCSCQGSVLCSTLQCQGPHLVMRLSPIYIAGRPSASLFFSRSSLSASVMPSLRWFTSRLMLHFSEYVVLSSCEALSSGQGAPEQWLTVYGWPAVTATVENVRAMRPPCHATSTLCDSDAIKSC